MTPIHHTAVLGQCRLRLVGPPAETAMNREDGVKLANIETALRDAGKSLWKAARVVNGGAPLIMRTESLGFTEDGLARSLRSIQRAVVTVEALARKFQNVN